MQAILSMNGDLASGNVHGMDRDAQIGRQIRKLRTQHELTQEQFAERVGRTTRGAVGNWERGKGISRANIEAIAATFGVNPTWLLTGNGPMQIEGNTPLPNEPANATIGPRLIGAPTLIPLYGQAVGGVDGEFVLNGNMLAEVMAPPSLSGVSGAYAVTVSGESMEPRYFDGEVVFVHPSKRVTKGDFVIAQIHNDADPDGPPLAFVKRFVRWNSNELILEQYNPVKELRFPTGKVVSVHYIIMGGAGAF